MTPLPPAPPQVDPARWARLGRWLRLARMVLLWERLWPLLLPVLCVLGLFVAFALFDLAPRLSAWGHGAVLVVSVVAVVVLLVRLAMRLRLPDWATAARRLERDSALEHRPLAVLGDRPAGSADPLAAALWYSHVDRALAALDRLRLSWPCSDMVARDPYGLRAGVLLILVIAASGGGDDAPRRLARALDVGSLGLAPDLVEVWLTPPTHTGRPPVTLRRDGAGNEPVAVPAGTAILAMVGGGWGDARLIQGGRTQSFQRQPDGSQKIETRLDRGGELVIRQSLFTVARWPVTVTADAVPSAAFSAPSEGDRRGRLHLAVSASDDYGLERVWVAIRRLGALDHDPVLEVALPLAGTTPREAELSGWFDLGAHPWAGMPVTLTPMVKDGAGQVSAGAAEVVTLPERQFANPVAAAVIDARRALAEDAGSLPEVADFLDRLLDEPQAVGGDLKTVLMLALSNRMLLSENGFDLDEVRELLWQAALRIEDGDLSSAERALDAARKALEDALDRGADAQEIQALLDAFQQALERTLAAMTAKQGTPSQSAAGGGTVGADELHDMVDRLRDLASAGARDALRRELAQLNRILQGLQPGDGMGGNPAQQGLDALRDLARRQQRLLDDSHAQARAALPAEGEQAAEAQRELRRGLAEVRRQLAKDLGEAPNVLDEAERAMDGAAGLLEQEEWDAAAEAQAQAMASLNRAAREVLEQVGGSGQDAWGMVPRDPLGRPQRGPGDGDDGTTHVPERGDIQRSRQLLDEIRRRAGDGQRPEPERDYLRRLLRQF